MNSRSYRAVVLHDCDSDVSIQQVWTIHPARSSRMLLRLRLSFFVRLPARCFQQNSKEQIQESQTKPMTFSRSCCCSHVHTNQSNGGTLVEGRRVKDVFCRFYGLYETYLLDERVGDGLWQFPIAFGDAQDSVVSLQHSALKHVPEDRDDSLRQHFLPLRAGLFRQQRNLHEPVVPCAITMWPTRFH